MHSKHAVLYSLALLTCCCPVDAITPPPFLGPAIAPPSNPSNSSAVQHAIQQIKNALGAGNTTTNDLAMVDFNGSSFSLDIYSVHEPKSIFTYHWSAPALSHPSQGVSVVGSDTVYRIGSVSKLLTVYTYLLAAGDASFGDPITKYVPGLAAYARQYSFEAVDEPFTYYDCNSITVGALASQMSGVPTSFEGPTALDLFLFSTGFPPVSSPAVSNCGLLTPLQLAFIPCNRSEAIAEILSLHPIFLPFETPAYSDAAYTFFSYALESITGDSMPNLFVNYLTAPLGMSSTTYTAPQDLSHAIIPLNDSFSSFTFDLHDVAPAGGFYSTINDLRRMGISILNSILLPPTLTRRWMKPHTFTYDPTVAVGAPWEIYRVPLNRTSWMYTKGGDINVYSSLVAYLPDWDVGFTVLTAWTESDPSYALEDMIAGCLVQALEEAARAEAAAKIAGTYREPSTGSTLTLGVDDHPGLAITNWTVGNVSVLSIIGGLYGYTAPVGRLYPTSMKSKNGTQTGWKARFADASLQCGAGTGFTFNSTCQSWVRVDTLPYYGIGMDEVLIETDLNSGRAVAVTARALRYRYARG